MVNKFYTDLLNGVTVRNGFILNVAISVPSCNYYVP